MLEGGGGGGVALEIMTCCLNNVLVWNFTRAILSNINCVKTVNTHTYNLDQQKDKFKISLLITNVTGMCLSRS